MPYIHKILCYYETEMLTKTWPSKSSPRQGLFAATQ